MERAFNATWINPAEEEGGRAATLMRIGREAPKGKGI
jgi:hypothetical protein